MQMDTDACASEEQPPHAPADALPVVQNVELVDELVHAVAGFSDGAQIRHQTHVIALLQEEKRAGVKALVL